MRPRVGTSSSRRGVALPPRSAMRVACQRRAHEPLGARELCGRPAGGRRPRGRLGIVVAAARVRASSTSGSFRSAITASARTTPSPERHAVAARIATPWYLPADVPQARHQDPLRRHRRHGHVRHRRGAREHGLSRVGLGHERHRDHAPPRGDRLHGQAGPPRRQPRRGGRRRRVERDQGLQPRGRGRARAPDPGDPARRDARRADADEVRHRGRRRARQDHVDDDDAHRADGRRARPDRGDRRPRQLARPRERALGQERLPGRRGRRERRLVPDAVADASRSSPTSTPSTSITTARSTTSRRRSPTSATACRSTG